MLVTSRSGDATDGFAWTESGHPLVVKEKQVCEIVLELVDVGTRWSNVADVPGDGLPQKTSIAPWSKKTDAFQRAMCEQGQDETNK